MSSLNRAEGRNVRIFYRSNLDRCLGGLIVNTPSSVTHANFLSWLEIIIFTSVPVQVYARESGLRLARTEDKLNPGNYDIVCQEFISVNDEPFLYRTISHPVTGRDDQFREAIRARDGKCVITGRINRGAYKNDWTSFEAAHIFPLAYGSYWQDGDFARWITNMEGSSPASKMNSCQNGILLQVHVHDAFDQYLIGINPDDRYKITCFTEDNWDVDGRILDECCRLPGEAASVRDQLLRWHLRQCVLANMRGAGEPIFETDFPPGTDMVGEILSGPVPGARMESELFSRLYGQGIVE